MTVPCRTCRRPVRWVKMLAPSTRGRTSHPLDPEPTPDGNVGFLDPFTVRILTKAELGTWQDARFTSHFATCPDADQHRTRKASQ